MIHREELADGRVTQDARRQAACASSSVQRIPHMLAVAPPTSVIVPLKLSCEASVASSRRTLASERLAMSRPWCSVMQQNAQPAAQPRDLDRPADLSAPGCARRGRGAPRARRAARRSDRAPGRGRASAGSRRRSGSAPRGRAAARVRVLAVVLEVVEPAELGVAPPIERDLVVGGELHDLPLAPLEHREREIRHRGAVPATSTRPQMSSPEASRRAISRTGFSRAYTSGSAPEARARTAGPGRPSSRSARSSGARPRSRRARWASPARTPRGRAARTPSPRDPAVAPPPRPACTRRRSAAACARCSGSPSSPSRPR